LTRERDSLAAENLRLRQSQTVVHPQPPPPLMATPAAASVADRPRRGGCYNCGSTGHYKAQCPFGQAGSTLAATGLGSNGSQVRNAASSYNPQKKRTYLRVSFPGATRYCLLDTGSDVTVLPSFWLGRTAFADNPKANRS
jgi:hypothetical protein